MQRRFFSASRGLTFKFLTSCSAKKINRPLTFYDDTDNKKIAKHISSLSFGISTLRVKSRRENQKTLSLQTRTTSKLEYQMQIYSRSRFSSLQMISYNNLFLPSIHCFLPPAVATLKSRLVRKFSN